MTESQKAALIEEFMPEAMRIALEMSDGSVPIEDLTQEAYVGLLMGLNMVAESEYTFDALPLTQTVEEAIRAQIASALEEIRAQIASALEEQRELDKRDKQLIAQVELLSKSIDAMTEELGTKPTVDEIANYMGVQQKTVLEILKLSGEELPEGEFYKENRLWIDNPDARKFSN